MGWSVDAQLETARRSGSAGTYQATAILSHGIGMRLKGWAANSGQTPWDYPANTGNWGGDHGTPTAVAADKDHVYLGWTGAEAGKALVAATWMAGRSGITPAAASAAPRPLPSTAKPSTCSIGSAATLYRLDRVKRPIHHLARKRHDRAAAERTVRKLLSIRATIVSAGGQWRQALSQQQNWPARSWSSMPPRAQFEAAERDKPSAVTVSPSGQLYVVSDGTKVLAFAAIWPRQRQWSTD